MTDFFTLSARDRRDALGAAGETLARLPSILEKDVMVVWTLRALYSGPDANHLSFKGGTSLSKVYGLINRFSEDIDITYDIRRFLGDEDVPEDGLPPSNSQGRRWTEKVRQRLPEWIGNELQPMLAQRAEKDGVLIGFERESTETLKVTYSPLHESDGYVRPAVLLEFGARSTGEPVNVVEVDCDAAPALNQLVFPRATVRAMTVGRTFWEKATAAHCYCLKGSMRGDRFSRHWHDLYHIVRSEHGGPAADDADQAEKVAQHKSVFFRESDRNGKTIDYNAAVAGGMTLVPEGDAMRALEEDYAAMQGSGMLGDGAPTFMAIIEECSALQDRLNGTRPEAAGPAI